MEVTGEGKGLSGFLRGARTSVVGKKRRRGKNGGRERIGDVAKCVLEEFKNGLKGKKGLIVGGKETSWGEGSKLGHRKKKNDVNLRKKTTYRAGQSQRGAPERRIPTRNTQNETRRGKNLKFISSPSSYRNYGGVAYHT